MNKLIKIPCPTCGASIDPAAKKCPACGTKFSAKEIAKRLPPMSKFAKIALWGSLAFLAFIIFAVQQGQKIQESDPAVQAEARAARAEASKRHQEMRERGEHCLDGPDELLPELVREVQGRLRDPSSFVHYRTWLGPNQNGKHEIRMDFGGANGFGGMNRGQATAVVDNQTCTPTDIKIDDQFA